MTKPKKDKAMEQAHKRALDHPLHDMRHDNFEEWLKPPSRTPKSERTTT